MSYVLSLAQKRCWITHYPLFDKQASSLHPTSHIHDHGLLLLEANYLLPFPSLGYDHVVVANSNEKFYLQEDNPIQIICANEDRPGGVCKANGEVSNLINGGM